MRHVDDARLTVLGWPFPGNVCCLLLSSKAILNLQDAVMSSSKILGRISAHVVAKAPMLSDRASSRRVSSSLQPHQHCDSNTLPACPRPSDRPRRWTDPTNASSIAVTSDSDHHVARQSAQPSFVLRPADAREQLVAFGTWLLGPARRHRHACDRRPCGLDMERED